MDEFRGWIDGKLAVSAHRFMLMCQGDGTSPLQHVHFQYPSADELFNAYENVAEEHGHPQSACRCNGVMSSQRPASHA